MDKSVVGPELTSAPAYLEEEGISESNRQVTNRGPFPSAPLTIIAATDHGPYFKE
jgi:hypothetical protein